MLKDGFVTKRGLAFGIKVDTLSCIPEKNAEGSTTFYNAERIYKRGEYADDKRLGLYYFINDKIFSHSMICYDGDFYRNYLRDESNGVIDIKDDVYMRRPNCYYGFSDGKIYTGFNDIALDPVKCIVKTPQIEVLPINFVSEIKKNPDMYNGIYKKYCSLFNYLRSMHDNEAIDRIVEYITSNPLCATDEMVDIALDKKKDKRLMLSIDL